MGKLRIYLILVCLCAQISGAHATTLSDTTISNYTEWRDGTIEIDGNLSIVNGGTLMINNCSVMFQNDYVIEHGVSITGNGNLTILDNSIFGTDDYTNGCNILLYDDAIIIAKDSTFQGMNGDSRGTIGLYRSSDKSYFYNDTFKDSYKAIYSYNVALNVTNCTFDKIKNTAISPTHGTLILKNTTFKNFPSYSYAVMPNGLRSAIIENNYFENMSASGIYGIDMLYYTHNALIRGNILNNTMRAIVVISEMDNITVENNSVYDNPVSGLFVGVRYNLSNVTIRNNIGSNLGEGIVSVGHGASGYNNEHIQIYGNSITNQGSYGPALSAQIQNSSVYDNIFQANASSNVAGLKTINYTSDPKGKIKNVIFRNNTFDGYKYGMEFHSGDNLTFIDCNIKNSSFYDVAFFDGDNKNYKFINTFFDETKIYFDNNIDTFEPCWYANIRVVDSNGVAVSGARVNITNIINPNCPPLCFNNERESNFVTSADGYAQSIKNKEDNIIIIDYSQNKSTKIEYKYRITAEKDDNYGYFILNPDKTFYCQEPNIPKRTITIVLQNNVPVITSLTPSNGSVFIEGQQVKIALNASDADNQALNYSIKIDGAVYSNSSSYVWETNYSNSGNHTIEGIVSNGIEEIKKINTVYINDYHPSWDINEDGIVDILDITLISQHYGEIYTNKSYPRWDVNRDGVVNITDLDLAGYHFGEIVK